MLVLTRKMQEKIQIGDGITITVIKTKGKSVRLGIEAPSDVSVLRGELCDDSAETVSEETASFNQQLPRDPAGKLGPTHDSLGESSVSFARVPQGKTTQSRVQTVLPNLLGEPGPLREMIAKR